MIPPPPRSTRPDPLLPYTPLFRSAVSSAAKLEHVMFKSIVILLLAAVVSACSSNTPSNNGISAAFRATELPGLLELESFAVERSEEHTSELQSLMRISYDVFCLTKKNNKDSKTPSQHKHILT